MNTRIHCSERRVCESVFTEHLICEKFSKEITFELEQPLRAEVERSTQWNEKFSRQKSLFAGVEEESKRREKSLVSKSEKSLFVFHLSWGGGAGGGKQKENADENIFIFSCRSWWNVAGALTWKLSEKLRKLSLWKFSYFSLGIFPALFLSFLFSLSLAHLISHEKLIFIGRACREDGGENYQWKIERKKRKLLCERRRARDQIEDTIYASKK